MSRKPRAWGTGFDPLCPAWACDAAFMVRFYGFYMTLSYLVH